MIYDKQQLLDAAEKERAQIFKNAVINLNYTEAE